MGLDSIIGRLNDPAAPVPLKINQEDLMAINKDLLDILACPKCKGDIHLNQNGDGLICDACRLMYPIKDDIPVMLIDEAVRL